MTAEITKEETEELISKKGEVRGLALKSHARFVVKKTGQEGLGKVTNKMAELGHPFDFHSVKPMDFYGVGIEALFLVLCNTELGFEENDFVEIGAFSAKLSLIIKLFAKHFVSVEKIAEKANEIWGKYYTEGKLEIVRLDSGKRTAVFKLSDFKIHPFHCLHVLGYIKSVLKMVVGKPVEGEEKECPFRKGRDHIFELNW